MKTKFKIGDVVYYKELDLIGIVLDNDCDVLGFKSIRIEVGLSYGYLCLPESLVLLSKMEFHDQ